MGNCGQAVRRAVGLIATPSLAVFERTEAFRRRCSVINNLTVCVILASFGLASAAYGATIDKPSTSNAFPSKPVRVIVPQTAGSSADFFARSTGELLSNKWMVPVVVDNRPGAGGSIAMNVVAKSNADGYTLAMTTEGAMAIIPHLYENLPYNTLSDLAPVTRVAAAPYILIVHPSVQAKSVKELIAQAKVKPGEINFASGGNGTGTHLSGELFKMMSAADIVHVPYKGASLGLTDLLGGQVHMMFVGLPPAVPHIRAGRLRALAVTTRNRNLLVPGVPTVAEGGLPGYEVAPWWGVLAPARTPSTILARLNADLGEIARNAGFKQRLRSQGAEAMTDTPAEFRKVIKTEYEKWGKVIKSAAIRIR